MIDYDKLRIAHELSMQYAKQNDRRFELCYESVINSINDSYVITLDIDSGTNELHKFYCVDDLIAKLLELTQPKAKYEKGQMVWVISWGDIKEVEVIEIYWDSDLRDYRLSLDTHAGKMSIGQSLVYPTKSALIESQIAYWIDLGKENSASIPPFEGPIKGFDRRQIIDSLVESALKTQPYYEPRLECDHPTPYTGDDKKIWCAKCGVCIKECQHERDESEAPKLSHFTAEEGCVFIVRCLHCQQWFRESKQECQHESDGQTYSIVVPSGMDISQIVDRFCPYKCKKCGEFYR